MHKTTLVILSERGPRRTLQPGGGESKDLRLFFNKLLTPHARSQTPAVFAGFFTEASLPTPPAPLPEREGDFASTDLYDAQPDIPIGKTSITLPPELPPDRKQKQRKQR